MRRRVGVGGAVALATLLATTPGVGAGAVAVAKTSAKGLIPAKVRAVLYNDVLADVAANRITNVGKIWLVATTLARTSLGDSSRPGSTPVYLVAWSGHKEITCKQRPGETCEGPDAFELAYSVSDLVFVGGESSLKYPAPLDELGTPVQLVKPRASQRKPPTLRSLGTIVVHVYWMGVPYPETPGCLEMECEVEREAIAVEKLGAKGKVVSSFETAAHTIHVAPGEYRVGRGEGEGKRDRLSVKADQVVEVTLYRPITD